MNPKSTMAKHAKIKNRLTRLGVHFLLLGGFAIFGGAFRGFNLLLVLAALVVGAMMIQWRWSRRNIAALTARRQLPHHVRAGQLFRVRFSVTNHNRYLPVWMVGIQDHITSLSGLDQATAGCAVASIPAGKKAWSEYECRLMNRGWYRLDSITIQTTFPFSLFCTRITVDAVDEIYVLPSLVRLRRNWQQQLLSHQEGIASSARCSGSADASFFGLRQWKHGDSPRWIHWRTTARLNEPIVRQFEHHESFDLCIVVDAHAPEPQDDSDAEAAISLATTILTKLSRQPSNRIVLGVAGTTVQTNIACGAGSDLQRTVAALASIETCDNPDVGSAILQSTQLSDPVTGVVVISSRSRQEAGSLQSQPGDAAEPTAPLVNLRWIDVRGNEFRQLVAEATA